MQNDKNQPRRNRGILFTSEIKTMISVLAGCFSSLELSYRLNVNKTTISNWLRGQARILSKNAANIKALYIEVMQNTASEAKTPDNEESGSFERESANPEPEAEPMPEKDISELLPIGNRKGIETVNARDLHKWLKVGRDFTTWIKDRISTYGFIEGRDYLLTKSGEQLFSGTKYKNEYYLTMDMAKELSMVQNNEKGKEARNYFIKAAKELQEIKRLHQEQLNMQLDQQEKRIEFEKERSAFYKEQVEFYKETSKPKTPPKRTYTPNGHKLRTIKWLLAQKPFLIKDQKQRTAFYTFLFGLNVITRDGVGCKEWRLTPDYAYMGKLTVTAKTEGYANRYIEISPEYNGVMNDFIKQFIDRQPGFGL